ncbi:hypothetical protein GJ744_007094 [Endocarpon pusillum]|uniref:Uncharacterized protein n=1 Tax=Endocarpon pusillum TaxID=364733 RepID=A0A8H7AJD8_9EURO|nr:hypothetical protein GJ744_007094 [Endocarpon pusillum]
MAATPDEQMTFNVLKKIRNIWGLNHSERRDLRELWPALVESCVPPSGRSEIFHGLSTREINFQTNSQTQATY